MNEPDEDSPWYGIAAIGGWVAVGLVLLIVASTIIMGGR